MNRDRYNSAGGCESMGIFIFKKVFAISDLMVE